LHRVKYALTRTVVTRGDNGDPQFNASNFIGIGASSTARAAWYPREAHRLRFGFGSFGSGLAFDAVGNLVREFFIHPRKKRDIAFFILAFKIPTRSPRQTRAELEGTRAARAEDLGGFPGRLAERGRVQIVGVAAEIRDVENVEPLRQERELEPLVQTEDPGEA